MSDSIALNLPEKYFVSTNDYLNSDVRVNEVAEQIKKLKNGKAPGIDGVINEFLKNSPVAIVENITKFFNLVLSSGVVPRDWTIGLIQPIYKGKGSLKNADNYRGITLLSSIGKLFTSILNDRIKNYFDCTGFLGDEQAGFRKGHSTLDHIFVLHSVIDWYLSKKKRVYCAFIDYKKAFDMVDRTLLWSKLVAHDINGRVLKVIHAIYNNAKSCIVNNGEKSDFFVVATWEYDKVKVCLQFYFQFF